MERLNLPKIHFQIQPKMEQENGGKFGKLNYKVLWVNNNAFLYDKFYPKEKEGFIVN